MANPKLEQVWARFAASAVEGLLAGKYEVIDFPVTERAAIIADDLLRLWDERYGDAAFFLQGQIECNACHQPFKGGEQVEVVNGLKYHPTCADSVR